MSGSPIEVWSMTMNEAGKLRRARQYGAELAVARWRRIVHFRDLRHWQHSTVAGIGSLGELEPPS
jgi:hypothetical protein